MPLPFFVDCYLLEERHRPVAELAVIPNKAEPNEESKTPRACQSAGFRFLIPLGMTHD